MDMDLEQKAIMRLREAADTSERFYKAPLIVTTSGGKDSSVCVALAEKAGIDFEVMHNHTTVDAPETVYFIRREFKRLEEKGVKCTVNYPHYRCFAPGRCKGRVVGVKRFDPYIPAWCPKLSKNGGVKQ